MAIYQRPHTSPPAPEHRINSYLLRSLVIERVGQSDVGGRHLSHSDGPRILYQTTVMDWVSRYILASS